MNKQEFLSELNKRLSGLPAEDIQQSVDYYSEMIDDRIEDGLTEADAVMGIGEPQDIAGQILMDIPFSKLVKQKIKPKRNLKIWEIVLLVLGAPLWASLVIMAVSIILSVYVVFWSVIISLYAINLSIAFCGVAFIIGAIAYMITGKTAQGIFALGAGLLCIGLAILMFVGFNQITKGLLWVSKKVLQGIKACFVKGDAK